MACWCWGYKKMGCFFGRLLRLRGYVRSFRAVCDMDLEANETSWPADKFARQLLFALAMTVAAPFAVASDVELSVSPNSVSESAGATTLTVTATLQTSSSLDTDGWVWITDSDSDSGIPPAGATAFLIVSGTTSTTISLSYTPTNNNLFEGNKAISVQGYAFQLAGDITDPIVYTLDVTPTSLTVEDDESAAIGDLDGFA